MINSLKYKDYTAIVQYSSEDDLLFGNVIGLNDLISFEGDSIANLKRAFQESIEDYITTCGSLGKTPEKSYKGSFNVRVSADLHKKIAFSSSEHGITLNDFVKRALNYVIRHEDDLSQELFREPE